VAAGALLGHTGAAFFVEQGVPVEAFARGAYPLWRRTPPALRRPRAA
jgi:hypothetical protein